MDLGKQYNVRLCQEALTSVRLSQEAMTSVGRPQEAPTSVGDRRRQEGSEERGAGMCTGEPEA